jgi:hypothetical protein
MNIRKLFLSLGGAMLFLALNSMAHAQCQGQGCVRPGASGCYTCGDLAGYACNVAGTCDTTCTESACPPKTGGDDELLTLVVPNLPGLPIAPKTPAWELRHTLAAAHFATAPRPQPARCGSLVLPKNVLFAL